MTIDSRGGVGRNDSGSGRADAPAVKREAEEDGRGQIAGHRPGYAYSPQQINDRARPRADDPGRRAFEDYQRRLTEAWKNP